MLIHVMFSNRIQKNFHTEGSENALQITYCLENPCVLFLEYIDCADGLFWSSEAFETHINTDGPFHAEPDLPWAAPLKNGVDSGFLSPVTEEFQLTTVNYVISYKRDLMKIDFYLQGVLLTITIKLRRLWNTAFLLRPTEISNCRSILNFANQSVVSAEKLSCDKL